MDVFFRVVHFVRVSCCAFPQLIYTQKGWSPEVFVVTITDLLVGREDVLSIINSKLKPKSSLKLKRRFISLCNLISFYLFSYNFDFYLFMLFLF